MKLRIRGNSIRFRLTQTEVQTLGKNNPVEEKTDFGNGQVFVYSISPKEMPATATASFTGGKFQIFLSSEVAQKWAIGDETGIETQSGELKILIEKDFNCLKPRDAEEDADTFPHPQADANC